jgi:hypothetical protein
MGDSHDMQEVRRRSVLKLVGVGLGIAVLAYLGGLVPTWVRAREYRKKLDAAERYLTLSQLDIALGSAAIDARRGDYEKARLEASRFFTLLRTETDKGAESALSAAQRESAVPFFSRRDALITLLARGDPASADRLSDLYVSYRKAIERPEATGGGGTNQDASSP